MIKFQDAEHNHLHVIVLKATRSQSEDFVVVFAINKTQEIKYLEVLFSAKTSISKQQNGVDVYNVYYTIEVWANFKK